MNVARSFAVAATFAAVAVGAATTAWADPDPATLSGHYIETETHQDTGKAGQTNDWYFTPCGDGCSTVRTTPNGQVWAQARLLNGRWIMDTGPDDAVCSDGSKVPGVVAAHYTWDPNTLAGTVKLTYVKAACGSASGLSESENIQFKPASQSGPEHR